MFETAKKKSVIKKIEGVVNICKLKGGVGDYIDDYIPVLNYCKITTTLSDVFNLPIGVIDPDGKAVLFPYNEKVIYEVALPWLNLAKNITLKGFTIKRSADANRKIMSPKDGSKTTAAKYFKDYLKNFVLNFDSNGYGGYIWGPTINVKW